MKPSDWEGVCFVLAKAWPGEFGKDAEAAYFFIVGDYERREVEAAIKLLARNGGAFRPSAAEIAYAIEQVNAPPTFNEAWPVIERATRRHYANHDRLLADVRDQAGEFAAGWIASYGVERLLVEPIHGEHGGAVMHRLQLAYSECSESEERRTRTIAALENGGLRLDRPLRRLDALAALGMGNTNQMEDHQ